MHTKTCFNCGKKSARLRALDHNGITSHLCAECHERLALALAASLRYAAIVRGMLGHARE